MFQYICENHFQRLSKKSIFTGLKAINHFGRPDMTSFLKFVQKKHSYVSIIKVLEALRLLKKSEVQRFESFSFFESTSDYENVLLHFIRITIVITFSFSRVLTEVRGRMI